MSSPFRRHQQKVLARKAAAAAGKRTAFARRAAPAPAPAAPEGGQPGTEYAALLAVLHENLRSLSDIASHEQRQPKKAEYAKQFANWVNGVLEADAPVQDEILVTMLVWAIDCRDFDRALQLAGFVLRHGLTLPERYSRTPACFLAEEIADLSLSLHEEVPHEVLLTVQQLTADFDMPDQVSARLHKALGRSWRRKAEAFDPAADNAPAGGALAYATEALAHLERALQLDGQAGVKKDIQQVASLKRKLSEAASAN